MNIDVNEFKELLRLKCRAHLKYLVNRASEESAKQIIESFSTVIDMVKASSEMYHLHPNNTVAYFYEVENEDIHKKVLATYEEIYYTIYNQYVGKTEGMYEVERL